MTRDGGDPFDASFFARVAALRFRVASAAGAPGGRRRGRGVAPAGVEFHDHHRYAPGDDPRLLDWNVLARWGRAFVKRFRAEGRTSLDLLLDATGSMGCGMPSKDHLARRVTGALALAALAGESLVRASVVGGTVAVRSFQGRGGIPLLLDHLRAPCGGGSDELLSAVAATRRGAASILVSDALDGPPLLEAIAAARSRGALLVLLQVLAPQEMEPAAPGSARLRDAESGRLLEGWVGERAAAQSGERARALVEAVRRFAARHAVPYFFSRSDRPFEAAAAEAMEALEGGR